MTRDGADEPLLRVSGLEVRHARDRGLRRTGVVALQDIGFELQAGDSLGIVGESGSGKSTLLRALLGLTPIADGSIAWQGRPLAGFDAAAWRALRRQLQPVFQDPLASLDPRMRVRALLAEPLQVHQPGLARAAVDEAIAKMLDLVGMPAGVLANYPHELSGGQCQRICIARAMLPGPAMLACDEPVSALDVSIQAQIMQLLQSLHRSANLTLIFVSHNLALVRRLCRRVIVLRQGRIVEAGDAEQVIGQPQHEYTRALIAAVPTLPRRQTKGSGP